MESISKNLWLLLTLVIPGFFTYGLWRLSLFFVTERPMITDAALKQIDESTLTTTCVIIAIAIIQQAIAISFEAFFYVLLNRKKKQKIKTENKSTLYTLFCERFILTAKGQLNERAERMVGNFFLSFNVSIGIVILIVYFINHIGFEQSKIPLTGLILLLPATLITTYFRMIIAKKIIQTKVGPDQQKNNTADQQENLPKTCQLTLICPFEKKKKKKKIQKQ